MPLFQTEYGARCPLGKFEILVEKEKARIGKYLVDEEDLHPLLLCDTCNFANLDALNVFGVGDGGACRCPPQVTYSRYLLFKQLYVEHERKKNPRSFLMTNISRKGFQDFVDKCLDGVYLDASLAPGKDDKFFK